MFGLLCLTKNCEETTFLRNIFDWVSCWDEGSYVTSLLYLYKPRVPCTEERLTPVRQSPPPLELVSRDDCAGVMISYWPDRLAPI